MFRSKTTILLSAATVLLATMASQPKVRGGVHMAVLLATYGIPYHAVACMMRLPALSTVDPSTCSTGTDACYLVSDDAANADANEEAWRSMTENERGQALAWFSLLHTESGLINVTQLLQVVGGIEAPGLEAVNEEDYKRAVGAAHRSLDDEGLRQAECIPVANFLDRNGDGTLSVHERIASMAGDCEDQAPEIMTPLCSYYVKLFSGHLRQGNPTLESWCTRMALDGDTSKIGALIHALGQLE